MQLNLFCSNTFRGAFELLAPKLNQGYLSGRDNLIIVPDKFTLTVEQAVLDKLGIPGAMNIEVMSFGRLAAATLGNSVYECLSPESSAMLLAKVIRENRESLLCYKGVRDANALAKDVFSAIGMVRSGRVSAEGLRQAGDRAKKLSMKNKARDLALLYSKYLEELSERYDDPATRLERLIAEIPKTTRIINSNVYITDFAVFNGTEYAVIEQLIRHAYSVNAALICSGPGNAGNARIYPDYTIKKLEKIAQDAGAIIQKIYKRHELNGFCSEIEKRLFGYEAGKAVDAEGSVKLWHAPDMESEIVAAARLIRRHAAEGGRYRDSALIAGGAEAYLPVIESVFKRFDIPYFIDRSEPVKNHPLIRYLTAFMEFAEKDIPLSRAIELIKNPFSGLKQKEADELDNYMVKYGLSARDIKRPFKLGTPEELNAAETASAPIRSRLKAYAEKERKTANEYIAALKRLLNASDADTALASLAERQAASGDRTGADVTAQIPNKLNELFAEITGIYADYGLSDEIISVFSAGCDGMKVSMIPQYIDCVIVGSPLESRYALIKRLFVVGAGDNLFPEARRDAGIITSGELAEWGINLFPNLTEAAALDKFYIHQLLLKAEKSIHMSYCIKASSGESSAPSQAMLSLKEIFKLEPAPVTSLFEIGYSEDERERAEIFAARLSARGNTLSELAGAIRSYMAGRLDNAGMKPYDAAFALLDRDARDELMGINGAIAEGKPYICEGAKLFFKRQNTSVSQLECYFRCPFQHFIRYGLGLKPREEAGYKPVDIGAVVHAALEIFGRRMLKEHPLYDIFDEELQVIIRESAVKALYLEEFLPLIREEDKELFLALIERSVFAAAAEIRKSRFKPFAVELEFGKSAEYPYIPLKYKDGALSLKGKIDRADLRGRDVVIADYKTGGEKDIIKNLYYGLKIQLFIYLCAMEQAGFSPAGAVYVNLNDKYVKEGSDTGIYSGFAVENAAVDFAPISKDFKPISLEGLKSFMDYAEKAASSGAAEIAEGFIAAKPADVKECGYCDFLDVCRARLTEPQVRKCSLKKEEDISGALSGGTKDETD